MNLEVNTNTYTSKIARSSKCIYSRAHGAPPFKHTTYIHEGETHPRKTPTQIKAQFAQTISGQFVQIVPPFSL